MCWSREWDLVRPLRAGARSQHGRTFGTGTRCSLSLHPLTLCESRKTPLFSQFLYRKWLNFPSPPPTSTLHVYSAGQGLHRLGGGGSAASTEPTSRPAQRSDELLALHHAPHALRRPRPHRPLLPPPRQVGVTRAGNPSLSPALTLTLAPTLALALTLTLALTPPGQRRPTHPVRQHYAVHGAAGRRHLPAG